MQSEKVNYYASFYPSEYYHVYNRTNNREVLFKDDQDKFFFLNQYQKFISPFVETFSYCLLPNHFHFLIRVKTQEEIKCALIELPKGEKSQTQIRFLKHGKISVHELIARQFGRLFGKYSMAFNLKCNRNGNLFHRPFKRVEVINSDHLIWLVYYINSNPAKHKVMQDFENYFWSSFKSLCSTYPTALRREDVLGWFGGKEAFFKFHLGRIPPPETTKYLELDDM